MHIYQARWNGVVLAESAHTIRVEGKYCTLRIGEPANPDAAWYYPHPLQAAGNMRGHVTFRHGVKVAKVPAADFEPKKPRACRWLKLAGPR
ncbi:DUF427 domain-containing protein [Arthrobacter sp. H35-D1]|uniref:DUF427 domain-containing protein n=1 Tax=Arthrobacter sp. H35-D1 TaxID=3046202 RepID=UPI0024B92FB9|nr:DUF427 domain-containing protein [Arthrobacter sp. H35-D1]MDJ0314149.1 DUF427 domain-containing protein [Arthrobacter sp. H35-D1]